MSSSHINDASGWPQSPLVQIDFGQLTTSPEVLSVAEVPFLSHINVRGAADNRQFLKAVKGVLELELPLVANRFVSSDSVTVLWYGPSEWLVLAPPDAATELVPRLQQSLGDTLAQVTDVSGGSTVLDIRGNRARELLNKACTIDLHPSVFATGHCVQTSFAHATAAIYQYEDAPAYRLIIRRSFADYLGTWMLHAANEFN